MSATIGNNKAFTARLISQCLLDDALEWIKDNLEPKDVFDASELGEWAESNGFIRDKDAESVVADRSSPEKVFKSEDLAHWARNNGYIHHSVF